MSNSGSIILPQSRQSHRDFELWRHRELLWQFALRNIELRHRGSHLGLIWSVLNPLLMLALYVFVFGYVFSGTFKVLPEETRMDYALAIFLGLSIFHFVAEVLAVAPTTIIGNPNFVKKVAFPLSVLPAANVAASLFHFTISFTLALVGVALLGPGLTVRVAWVPVIVAPLVLLALGIAWFVAAAGVFFRDIVQVVGFLSMVLMFASAVFYPASSIPPPAWTILKFNPILLAIELVRDAVMWNRPIDLVHLGYVAGSGVVAALVGYKVFRRLAPAFADVL